MRIGAGTERSQPLLLHFQFPTSGRKPDPRMKSRFVRGQRAFGSTDPFRFLVWLEELSECTHQDSACHAAECTSKEYQELFVLLRGLVAVPDDGLADL